MSEIELSNLTDSTNADNGTGVFDKLIQAVEQHILSQHKAGRITGSDYADVYLGSMQSVLSESVKFLLTEQQAEKQAELIAEQVISEQRKNEPGGLIDLEKKKNQEEIDLIIAQTASQYEGIDASRKDTNRKNLLNSKQVIKIGNESELISTQNSELLQNGVVERDLKEAQKVATASGAVDNTNKVNADVALTNSKEDDQLYVTSNIRPLEVTKIGAETDLTSSKKDDQAYITTNLRPAELAKLGSETDLTVSKEADQSYITTNVRPLETTKLQEEIDLLASQDLEQKAHTTRSDEESAKKVLLLTAQHADQTYVTTNMRPVEVTKLEEEVDLLESRDLEQIAATVRMDLESAKKVLLIEAQTLGFKVNGKQNLLKQMFEGFAIETTTNGAVTSPAPSINSGTSLDMVANSIFDDLDPSGGTI